MNLANKEILRARSNMEVRESEGDEREREGEKNIFVWKYFFILFLDILVTQNIIIVTNKSINSHNKIIVITKYKLVTIVYRDFLKFIN